MKKRVVVDARMIGAQGHGIGNYVLDLAIELSTRSLPFELFYLLSPECPVDSPLRSLPHRISAIPFLHRMEPIRLAKEIEGDLFHSPSFMSLVKYPCPHIQTVHDLNHLHFGKFSQKKYYRYLLLPSLRKARAVLSVSESAAQEIELWLKNRKVFKKIAVAYNAIAPLAPREDSVLARFGLEKNEYFFCLANPKAHKNTRMLEAAYARALSGGDILPLLINTKMGKLSPGEIHSLLAHARAFFSPSLYEGFGRPPLEAALSGTAPFVSVIPAHLEVLSGVKETEFLDPKSTGEWASLMQRLSLAPKKEMSATSREWISQTYARARLGDVMEKVYLEQLGL